MLRDLELNQDLKVMSLTRYHFSIPRYVQTLNLNAKTNLLRNRLITLGHSSYYSFARYLFSIPRCIKSIITQNPKKCKDNCKKDKKIVI